MKKSRVLAVGVLAMGMGWQMASAAAAPNAYFKAEKVAGVKNVSVSLDGDEWEFKMSPEGKWGKISVPGEPVMQGYGIKHDVPVFYKRTFTVPADWKGKRVVLRFDGVYSYATVKVNGKEVADHRGGFTRWEIDITNDINLKGENTLELEIIDPVEEMSYASGYAHHPVGGILRSVTLLAQPKDCITDVVVNAELDSLYRDGVLNIECDYSGNGGTMSATLADASGKVVAKAKNIRLKNGENKVSMPVDNPEKWTAESPYLYTLTIDAGNAQYKRNVGFRKIEIKGDRMLVNGMPVKLRGACRHDLHPTLGRTTTPELDSLDVMLFKDANMNFVRTSHYPPSEKFVELCDRYGIYVECETAACFVDTYRQRNYAPGASQSDPAFADQYVSQCREMLSTMRDHPSVLFWSIGNESQWGSNYAKALDYVRTADTTRPVIFSYPGLVPEEEGHTYDILSMHYPDTNGNLWQNGKTTAGFQGDGKPAIFDEWAHPACYTYATLQTDPNIREFWGKSLDLMWNGVYHAPGALGGAIWGYIDETFAVPALKEGESYWKEFAHTAKPEGFQGECVGYGEWGIVDVWRRKKPEFWGTKKSYSPVVVARDRDIHVTPGRMARLTLENRFDHTALNEIKGVAKFGGHTVDISMPATKPHGFGLIEIPLAGMTAADSLILEFYDADGRNVETALAYAPEAAPKVRRAGGTIDVADNGDFITVSGNGFKIPFNKTTGLIEKATAGGKTIIERGPFANVYVNLNHLSGAEVRKTANHISVDKNDWVLDSISHRKAGNNVEVAINGHYGDVAARYDVSILPDGRITVEYAFDGLPNGYLRELGVAFDLPEAFESVQWERNGYWDYYPAGEFAGNSGSWPLYNPGQAGYREKPEHEWSIDSKNYYYWADAGAPCENPLTNGAKGMKENVKRYALQAKGGDKALVVASDKADVACRINKTEPGKLLLYANNRWDYPEIAWGNYCKCVEALPAYGKVTFIIE